MNKNEKYFKLLKKHRTLLVSILLVFVLVTSTAGFVMKINSSMWDNSTVNIKGLSDVAADTLHENISNTQLVLANFADTLAFIDEKDIQPELADFTTRNYFSRTAVVSTDGTGIYNDGSPAEFPGKNEAWFDFTTSPDISRAYFGWNGQRQITMRCEITKHGKNVGTLYGFTDLQRYYMESAMEFYDGCGYSYMIDASDGRYLVYTKDTSSQGSYTTLFSMLLESENSPEEVDAFQQLMMDNQIGSTVLKIADIETFLYATPVNPDMNWYLVAAVPVDSIQKSGNYMILLTSILCAFVVIVICMVLVQLAMRRQEKDRAAAGARRERNQLFNLIANTIDTVIMIYKTDTKQMDLVFQNCGRVLGLDLEAVKNQPEEYMTEKGIDFLAHNLELMADGKLTENVTARSAFKNPVTGKEQWLKIGLYPAPDTAQCVIVIEDQTEEERVKQLLEDALASAESANHAKSMFLSNMSHDIRTPMNGIIGMTVIAEQNLEHPQKIHECLQKITMSAQHLIGLINDVLDMSKIESGKMTLAHDPFRFHELIENVTAMLEPQAAEKNQHFSIEGVKLSHDCLIGDTLRLNQILINLLSNSIKYTHNGGEISMRIQEQPQRNSHYIQVRFTISDNGRGMTPEFLEHLFQPFYSQSKEGTGLGMSIVKNLVTLIGGSIQVQSAVNQGTTVQLELPFEIDRETSYSAADHAAPRRQTPRDFSFQGRRILLVEDNELNTEIATELLKMTGAQCECACNGEEAVKLFCSSAPGYYDIILMDIQMPVMNGYEAAKVIRNSGHKDATVIPIIAMTANAFQDDIAASQRAGMDDHIAKPIDVQKLYAAIEEFLSNGRQGR